LGIQTSQVQLQLQTAKAGGQRLLDDFPKDMLEPFGLASPALLANYALGSAILNT